MNFCEQKTKDVIIYYQSVFLFPSLLDLIRRNHISPRLSTPPRGGPGMGGEHRCIRCTRWGQILTKFWNFKLASKLNIIVWTELLILRIGAVAVEIQILGKCISVDPGWPKNKRRQPGGWRECRHCYFSVFEFGLTSSHHPQKNP